MSPFEGISSDMPRMSLQMMEKKENYSVPISKLCERVNYSQSQIIRLFKVYLNTTPVKLFNGIKLNYAKSLLESTNMSILDISMEVGYESLGFFNVAFKKHFGISPGKYRRTLLHKN